MFTKRPEYKTHTSISLGDRQLQPAQQFYLKTMIVVHNRTDDGKPSLLFIGYHCSLPYITYVTPTCPPYPKNHHYTYMYNVRMHIHFHMWHIYVIYVHVPVVYMYTLRQIHTHFTYRHNSDMKIINQLHTC